MAKAGALADDVEALAALAASVLRSTSHQDLTLATAESCTGGLLASLLTDIEGLSGRFERGFAVYSDQSKSEMLGVDPAMIARHGAVSREVALAMARGALVHSRADLAAAITGFAGPAGSDDEEGLVHVAVHSRRATAHRECHFGRLGRDRVRHLATRAALELLDEALTTRST